jgi:hypothetical protein
MGKQVNFYFTGVDTESFDGLLRERSDCAIIKLPQKTNSLVLSEDSLFHTQSEWLKLYLTGSGFMNDVKSKYIAAQSYWLIDDLRSPVLEYTRSAMHDKTLRRGRIFFEPGYFDVAGKWTDKDPEFVAWAMAIMELVEVVSVRKDSSGTYIGADVELNLAQDRFRLLP